MPNCNFHRLPLACAYPSRFGAPVLSMVDPRIFTMSYFGQCLACGFCKDACCSSGVDVDRPAMERILAHADALEPLVGLPRDQWFTATMTPDADFPDGAFARTRTRDGACVFLDRQQRGCKLHRFALEAGIDVARLKPVVSALFPLTFDRGLLKPADEALAADLECRGPGESLYRGSRWSLSQYFGDGLTRELDALEASPHGATREQAASIVAQPAE